MSQTNNQQTNRFSPRQHVYDFLVLLGILQINEVRCFLSLTTENCLFQGLKIISYREYFCRGGNYSIGIVWIWLIILFLLLFGDLIYYFFPGIMYIKRGQFYFVITMLFIVVSLIFIKNYSDVLILANQAWAKNCP
jgi:hypothetical protein